MEPESEKENNLYDTSTVGGVMKPCISVKETDTVLDVMKELQSIPINKNNSFFIYVVDSVGTLKGVVKARDLATNSFEKKISEILEKNITCVNCTDSKDILKDISYKFGKVSYIPVVNNRKKLLGEVNLLKYKKAFEDDEEEESVNSSFTTGLKNRLPWLMINIVTILLASIVINQFEGTISKVAILATFMPIVSGISGNGGGQVLSVIVRGIALGNLKEDNYKKVFIKEFVVGVINAVVTGLIVAVIAAIWDKDMYFGIVIGAAMILSLFITVLLGYIVPLILKKFGVDPAMASSIFVTTTADIVSFLITLGFAQMFIKYIT